MLGNDAPEGLRLCAMKNIPEGASATTIFSASKAVSEAADREHTVNRGAGRKLVWSRFAWVMVVLSEARQASQQLSEGRGGLGASCTGAGRRLMRGLLVLNRR